MSNTTTQYVLQTKHGKESALKLSKTDTVEARTPYLSKVIMDITIAGTEAQQIM